MTKLGKSSGTAQTRGELRSTSICWKSISALRGSGMNAKTFVLCCALFLAAPLFAREKSDVIIMKNGDRVTCEIKGLEGDTLFISVDYILSTLSVDWSKVDHVESKQLFIVKTQDGIVYSGTLATPESPAGRPIKIEVLESPSKPVELDKTQIIKMDQTSNSFWGRFNGDIGLGTTYNKGNQSLQYNLSSSVSYPRERWSAGVSYNSTLSSSTRDTPATRNQITLVGKRLLRWNNWYYAGIADFMQSSEQGIRLQSSIGGGIGRYLVNNNHAQISLLGGLAWQRISYQQNIVPSTSQDVASGLVGGQVRLFYFNKTTLSLTAYALPAVSEPGRVHFNLNTSYYVKLWSNFKWNISFYGNWDNQPPPGFSGSDYGTSSGVTWTFGNR
jgi:hypothetical protein